MITFAAGQTFPGGSGGGTITGVTAGSGLTGGGTTGTVSVSVDPTAVPLLATSNLYPGTDTFAGGLQVVAGTAPVALSYPLDVVGGSASQPMVGVTTAGQDAAISLRNQGANGREYWLDSGATGAGVGAGNLAIWDATAGAPRLVVDPNGHVGIGTVAPWIYSGLEVDGGIYIQSNAPNYPVWAQMDTPSTPAYDFTAFNSSGIYADGGRNAQWVGIAGFANDNFAGYFGNNSAKVTMYLSNMGTGTHSNLLRAESPRGVCSIDGEGNTNCTGSIKSVNSVQGGARQLETYAVQASGNWYEDFGSSRLVNGVARVALEADFASTVNTSQEYHVYLTANGDTKGLYVINKGPGSFEVREAGGGTSNVAFDYRIVAKRRGYETMRMLDVTARMKAEAEEVHPRTPPAGMQKTIEAQKAARLARASALQKAH